MDLFLTKRAAITFCLNLWELYIYMYRYIRILCLWALLNSLWQVANGGRDNSIFVYQLKSRPVDWSFPLSSRWSVGCFEVLNSLWSQGFRRWGLHHVSGLVSLFLVRLQVCRSRVLWNQLAVLLPSQEGRSGISLALWLNWLEASLFCFSFPLGSMLCHHTHIFVIFSGLLLCKRAAVWGWVPCRLLLCVTGSPFMKVIFKSSGGLLFRHNYSQPDRLIILW